MQNKGSICLQQQGRSKSYNPVTRHIDKQLSSCKSNRSHSVWRVSTFFPPNLWLLCLVGESAFPSLPHLVFTQYTSLFRFFYVGFIQQLASIPQCKIWLQRLFILICKKRCLPWVLSTAFTYSSIMSFQQSDETAGKWYGIWIVVPILRECVFFFYQQQYEQSTASELSYYYLLNWYATHSRFMP